MAVWQVIVLTLHRSAGRAYRFRSWLSVPKSRWIVSQFWRCQLRDCKRDRGVGAVLFGRDGSEDVAVGNVQELGGCGRRLA